MKPTIEIIEDDGEQLIQVKSSNGKLIYFKVYEDLERVKVITSLPMTISPFSATGISIKIQGGK